MKRRYAPMNTGPFDVNAMLEERSKNKYAGPCASCGVTVAAGTGKLMNQMYKPFRRECYCLKCHGNEVTRRGDMGMEAACGIC